MKLILLLLSCLIYACAGGALRGLVVDQSGKPIPNAKVTIRQQGKDANSALRAKTGHDGSFEVDGIDQELFSAAVEASGFCKITAYNLLMAEKEDFRLSLMLVREAPDCRTLDGNGIILGKVVDIHDMPIPAATISLDGTTRGGVTRLDGSYKIGDIPSGQYNLRINQMDFGPVVIENVCIMADSTAQINITLSPVPIKIDSIGIRPPT
jgi:hypothetical protein